MPEALPTATGDDDHTVTDVNSLDHQSGRQQAAWVEVGHRWRSLGMGVRQKRRASTQSATEPKKDPCEGVIGVQSAMLIHSCIMSSA
jgi:hypothetical protein